MLAHNCSIFFTIISFLSKLFLYVTCRYLAKSSFRKGNFSASKLDNETKFKLFMLLLDKTEPGRCTMERCKATNGFNFFFYTFQTNVSYAICLVTPINAILVSN